MSKPFSKECNYNIPQNWKIEVIGNIVDSLRPPRYGIVQPGKFVGDGPLMLRSQDYSKGWCDSSTMHRVAHELASQYKNAEIRSGDLIMTVVGSNTGQVVEAPSWLNGSVLSRSTARIAVHPDYDSKYVKYFLDTAVTKKQIKDNMKEGAQPVLSCADLAKIQIFLPTHQTEQEAIANALSDADAYIESLEKLIEKKRLIKKGVMQDYLTGKRRIEGFANNKIFKKNDLGLFPTDWVAKSLKELIDPNRAIRYGIVQPGKYDPMGNYMIRGQDYSAAKGWAEPSEIFKVNLSIEEKYINARVKKGDLIMTIVGYCGHVEEIPDWLDGANLTQTTARLAIMEQKAIPRYCKYFLSTELALKQVSYYIKGAAQPGLNCGDVEKFLVMLPPTIEEQRKIAELISSIDEEIFKLVELLTKAKNMKLGMMQELLTGRIRLV